MTIDRKKAIIIYGAELAIAAGLIWYSRAATWYERSDGGFMRKLVAIWSCLLILFVFARTAEATVIDFEDLTGTGILPTSYHGFTWGNLGTYGNDWFYWDGIQTYPPYTPSSGAERIYNNAWDWNTMTGVGYIDFGQLVSFQGSYVYSYSPGPPPYEMWWEGFRNDQEVFESPHITASDSGVWINVDWPSVDRVQFVSTHQGGVFVLDDIRFNDNPVPEPASLLLLGTGLAAAAARRRSRKQSVRGFRRPGS